MGANSVAAIAYNFYWIVAFGALWAVASYLRTYRRKMTPATLAFSVGAAINFAGDAVSKAWFWVWSLGILFFNSSNSNFFALVSDSLDTLPSTSSSTTLLPSCYCRRSLHLIIDRHTQLPVFGLRPSWLQSSCRTISNSSSTTTSSTFSVTPIDIMARFR